MPTFIGTFENRIDKKGRISVPAPFRNALAGQNFHGIVAFSSFRSPAVEAAGMDFIEQLNDRIEAYDVFSEEHDDLAMAVFGNSYQLAFDGDGRVMLPEPLMAHADLNDRASFVGKGKMFQIWNPDTLAAQMAKARERAKDRGLSVPSPLSGPRESGGTQGGGR